MQFIVIPKRQMRNPAAGPLQPSHADEARRRRSHSAQQCIEAIAFGDAEEIGDTGATCYKTVPIVGSCSLGTDAHVTGTTSTTILPESFAQ